MQNPTLSYPPFVLAKLRLSRLIIYDFYKEINARAYVNH